MMHVHNGLLGSGADHNSKQKLMSTSVHGLGDLGNHLILVKRKQVEVEGKSGRALEDSNLEPPVSGGA